MRPFHRSRPMLALYALPILLLCLVSWAMPARFHSTGGPKSDGPTTNIPTPPREGDARAGRNVFRFETFGNEGFWTDAMRLPKGMMDAKFTPLDALKAGLHVDVDRVDPAMRQAMAAELKTDLSPENAPLLNDPATTIKLVNANAVIGVVARDTDGDGRMDITHGDKVGIACALCHTITDESVYALPGKGTIGHRLDGRATHSISIGGLLALAANSRAYYPNLQVEMDGKTIGRAPKGLTVHSTEAQVDAYLNNPKYYPVGMFDETSDGIGNPVQNTPLFRQDLAGPYGSAGEHAVLDNIGNGSYTVNLDQTTLVTPGGRQFLKIKAGAAGLKLAHDYAIILKETGVRGYPYVRATKTGKAGDPATPVGLRVNNKKLLDMNAYIDSLPAPPGVVTNVTAVARGRELFRESCTNCHNVDQSKPVPPILVPMKRIFPGYRPVVLARRKPPLTPVQNSPGGFDDKMIVVDASDRGGIRGNALPLLLDLARKPKFLHDASVPGLNALLDPHRGALAPHPFYLRDASRRADMVAFLRSLDTSR